jgi:putative transposase
MRCGRKPVARLMRAHGRHASRPRRPKPRTTASQSPQPVAPNLLGRDGTATAPKRKWVAASTSIPTHSGWLALAGILAGYARRRLGAALDSGRDERLVETAWDRALVRRRPRAGLVHHCDRGRQATSHGYRRLYRRLLDCSGIVLSMSGKGEPGDNALMESGFGTRKAACVERHAFQPPAPARACIFAYLEVFAHRQRLHSSLGSRSPLACAHLPGVT